MAMNFGKLNFAVGFNRTSAFPLDANSYFEDYVSAETAASGAAEVGSSDSAYYIGQVIIVKDTTKGVGLYQIGADKKLVKFGQASSEADLAEKISALETRATTIEGKLILATTEADGFMSKEDKAKLDGIAEGATKVIVDGELTDDGVNPVQGKAIKAAIAQVDGDVVALEGRVDGIEATANAAMPKAGGEFTGKVSGVATADADGATTFVTKGYVDTKLGNKVDVVDGKGLSTNDYDNAAKAIVDGVTDELAKKVNKVEGKGLSTNDYDNAAVAEVAKVKDKLDSATFNSYKEETETRVSGIEGNVSDLQDKIKGVTGAMHFKGVLTELPEDKSSYVAGDVIIVDKKEYVLADEGDSKEWHELGDEGSHITRDEVAQTYLTKESASTTYITKTQAGTDIATAKQEAIDAANGSLTTAKGELETAIGTAKTEAITTAGTNADTKISEALKAYTTTEDLNKELAKKLESADLTDYAKTADVTSSISTAKEETLEAVDTKLADYTKTTDLTTQLSGKVDKVTGKSLVSDDLVTKLEAIQDNAVIKGVEGGIKLDAETGKISVDAENIPEIAQAKVTGLVDKLSEIDTSLGTKQTADQVNALIQDATIKGEKITGAVALATSASTADKVAHVLTVGDKAYNGSEDITITADDLGALTEIPQATESALGGIKVGYNSTSANDCPVILSAEGQAYVTIPAVPEALIKTIEDTQFEVTAGKLSLKAVSTDLLVQGSKEFILDGGNAAGDEYDF